jgi:hypothetical protein
VLRDLVAGAHDHAAVGKQFEDPRQLQAEDLDDRLGRP